MEYSFLFLVVSCALTVNSVILRLPCRQFSNFADVRPNSVLSSTFRTLINTDLQLCKDNCFHDGQCKSLNIQVSSNTCQLNEKSAEDPNDNIKVESKAGWTYHSTFYNESLIGDYCLQNKPCPLGTKCYDTCSCPGYRCEAMRSCFDWYKNGMKQNGIYTIRDASGNPMTVYCDFSSGGNFAWMLIMSFSLANNIYYSAKPLTVNFPRHENAPNWNNYRMSKPNMEHFKSISSHWRATCSFESFGFDGRDFVTAHLKNFNPMALYGGVCMVVDDINVRGHGGPGITVPFWQHHYYLLHTDSSLPRGCQFDAFAGSVPQEDNFGHYRVQNPAFRCTANQRSTTQYWFGGKVL